MCQCLVQGKARCLSTCHSGMPHSTCSIAGDRGSTRLLLIYIYTFAAVAFACQRRSRSEPLPPAQACQPSGPVWADFRGPARNSECKRPAEGARQRGAAPAPLQLAHLPAASGVALSPAALQGLGKVAQLGAGASKFAVGERVVSMEPWKCVSTCFRTVSAFHANPCLGAHTSHSAATRGPTTKPCLLRCVLQADRRWPGHLAAVRGRPGGRPGGACRAPILCCLAFVTAPPVALAPAQAPCCPDGGADDVFAALLAGWKAEAERCVCHCRGSSRSRTRSATLTRRSS